MINECTGCQGENCPECGEHFHGWDGWHYCHPAARREIASKLAAFADGLNSALAVANGRSYHSVDCRTVKAHLTVARNIIAGDEPAYCEWRPWGLVNDVRVVGFSNRCCSPPILIQRPPRSVRATLRLTGLGWPGEDGRCTKGRLPSWTRAEAQP